MPHVPSARMTGTPARHAPGSAATCPHLPACPGCPRFGAGDASPEAVQRLQALCEPYAARHHVEIGARQHFRHRARLAVRGRRGRAKIGIFSEGSHRVVDIPTCPIHHPLINDVAMTLKTAIRELGTECYSDSAHVGLVRALQVAVERSSQTAQVVLVCNAATPASAQPLLELLERRLRPRLHSLWWNGNPERTNRILGDAFQLMVGPPWLVERIGGARVSFPPGAFGQNNLDLFDRIVERIHGEVEPGAHVVELYAGSGAIGLGLAARSSSLVMNERSPAGLAGLAQGIADLPLELQSRLRLVPGPAEQAVPEIQSHSVVIVDPPRKGLDPEVLAGLAQRAPARLFYLSCDMASLVRDTAALHSQGLVLTWASAYDLFPYTEHIETLACFERRSA